eukprot:scaffold69465_cov38-Tisochrysis_lutea.AAC.2
MNGAVQRWRVFWGIGIGDGVSQYREPYVGSFIVSGSSLSLNLQDPNENTQHSPWTKATIDRMRNGPPIASLRVSSLPPMRTNSACGKQHCATLPRNGHLKLTRSIWHSSRRANAQIVHANAYDKIRAACRCLGRVPI